MTGVRISNVGWLLDSKCTLASSCVRRRNRAIPGWYSSPASLLSGILDGEVGHDFSVFFFCD